MPRTRRQRSWSLWLTMFVAVAASCAVAASFAAESAKVFIGYVYRTPPAIRFELYTHACHAFVVADEAGNLTPNPHVPSRQFVQDAHAANVKALLSLGGWGWDRQFAVMTSSRPAWRRYVDAVIRLVDEYDYDGVDLDWEYPDSPTEVAGFERLVREFRRQLDELSRRKQRPMLLTMAASANPQTLRWLDRDLLLNTMDWIHVMTYDYTGAFSSFAGHHAPLFASSGAPADQRDSIQRTMNYLVKDRQFLANRLVVGLPLYGRHFAVSAPYASTEGVSAPSPESSNFARLHQLHTDDGWQRHWDDETKTPWLVAPDQSSVACYDDAASMRIKTAWAMKQGFRGVFFWQIAGDRLPDGANPLQEAALRAWKNSLKESEPE